MKIHMEDTPPSSVNGDEIGSMENEGVLYFEDMEEVQLDDEEMEYLFDQEEEYSEMEYREDHSELVFKQHSASVFCCDIHPNGKIAVSGGEDDKAYVWSVSTGNIIMDCTGHKDSVIFAGFSFDGAFLATVDMSGVIKVWKCVLEESHDPWPLAFEFEADDLTWGLWHFGTRVLICGSATGDIYVFKVPSGDTKVLQGHNSRSECGKVFSDGVRLAAGYEDGAVKIWDLKTNSVLQQVPASVHQTRVTAIDVHPENSLVASVSTDGKVVLTTASNGKIVAELETDNDLEVVAFSPDPQLDYFALGTLNGSITIWDTARQMIRHHCLKPEGDGTTGVTRMLWVKDQIIVGCINGTVAVYNARSGEKSFVLSGHWSEVLDLCYNAKENIILTTSDDCSARIFKFAEKVKAVA